MYRMAENSTLIRPRRWLKYLFPTLVLLSGVVLLLARLGDSYLWQDEAETALISRHLLTYGLPLSTDGTDWVQQYERPFVEFTNDYVWIYHSWLQYALTAASFALLGPSTFAARLPFVLAGLTTLLFFYFFLLRWLQDERTARVATVLLVLCVPFLLLMRQDRYYALATLFTLVTLDAYLYLRMGTPWAIPYFVLTAVLLYQSHYGAFFPTLAALGLHWLLSPPERKAWPRFLAATGLIALLTLPWAAFMRVLNRGQAFRLDRFWSHLGQHAVYITGWIFPVALLVALLVALVRSSRGQRWSLTSLQAQFCVLVGLVTLSNVVVLAASAAFDWVFFRYIVHLIPLLLAMLAIVVAKIMQRSWVAGVSLVLVLVTSNGLHMLPYGLPGWSSLHPSRLWPDSPAFQAIEDVWSQTGHFRSDLWMYVQELTHEYQGPNEGLASYLNAQARPGQTVVINYEDLPLMFYTPLRVLGGLGAHGLERVASPDWVIDRRYGPYRERLASLVAAGSYERIQIPYPDIRWENRPEPGTHQYLTPQGRDEVVLYRRVGE